MKQIKVYIVDEAVLVRQMLADILHTDPAFKVVGVSAGGAGALEAIPHVKPDVLLLNIMDKQREGLHTLSIVQDKYPDLPVVVLSHRSQEGAAASFKALSLGAVEFITKTEHPWLLLYAGQHLKKRLIPTLKTVTGIGKVKDSAEADLPLQEPVLPALPVEIVVMGGCIGSPLASMKILQALPADFPVPVLVALHMPKIFTREFAEMVDRKSDLKVREAYNGALLEKGTAWIAQGGFHLTVNKQGIQTALRIHRGPRENKCRPSIDTLFRSAVDHFGGGTMGVILSGRGKDGVEGAGLIHRIGGQVLIQSRRSSSLWELPKNILEARIPAQAFDSEDMARAIARKVYASHAFAMHSLVEEEADEALTKLRNNPTQTHTGQPGLWDLSS